MMVNHLQRKKGAWYKNSNLVWWCSTLAPQRINWHIFSSYLLIVCLELWPCLECSHEDKLLNNVGGPHKIWKLMTKRKLKKEGNATGLDNLLLSPDFEFFHFLKTLPNFQQIVYIYLEIIFIVTIKTFSHDRIIKQSPNYYCFFSSFIVPVNVYCTHKIHWIIFYRNYYTYHTPPYLSHLTFHHWSPASLSTHTSLLFYTQQKQTYSTLGAFIFLIFSVRNVLLTLLLLSLLKYKFEYHLFIEILPNFTINSSPASLQTMKLCYSGFIHSARSGYIICSVQWKIKT